MIMHKCKKTAPLFSATLSVCQMTTCHYVASHGDSQKYV